MTTNTVLAYRIRCSDTTEDDICCPRCYAELEPPEDPTVQMRVTAITNPYDLPEGPPGLGYECDSPFCEERLPTREERR